MQLTPSQVTRFYGIWFPLLRFVNKKRQVIEDSAMLQESLDPNHAAAVRDVLWADDYLLEEFVKANPADLTESDLAVAKNWRWRVREKFLVVKHLKKYSVFISNESGEQDSKVYAVVGINCPIEDVIFFDLPSMVDATLIPFEGKITYDSLLTCYPVRLGRNITNTLNHDYQSAKKSGAIIESLERPSLTLVSHRRAKT